MHRTGFQPVRTAIQLLDDMAELYRRILSDLLPAFPRPGHDDVHGADLLNSIQSALDQLAALKSAAPFLGEFGPLDYTAARRARIGDAPSSRQEVTSRLLQCLSGMFLWADPRVQSNVDPSPTTPSILATLLASVLNPNLVSDESSRRVAVAELEALSMAAGLIGYDPDRAGGLFTFGGTATTLYGVKIGLEEARPETMCSGLRGTARVVCSEQAHDAVRTAAGWLGLGFDSVVEVPADRHDAVRPCLLETICRDLLKQEEKIAAIVATLGTTDSCGLDDLQEICAIRDRLVDEFSLDYVPHVHADAVIGWAWRVFSDYDFERNPLGFRGCTLRALAGAARALEHLGLADSIGIDFHKTAFAPYTSSLFLVRDKRDLSRIARGPESLPYLYQSGDYHPGRFTLETSRSAGGLLSALANLLLFGKDGLRALLGHLVDLAEMLRAGLEDQGATCVLNRGNFGPMTLFRVYPEDGGDTLRFRERELSDASCREKVREYNAYNRQLFDLVRAEALQGRGIVISLSEGCRRTDYGEPVVALKSCITSPVTEERHVEDLLQSLSRARQIVARDRK